MPSANGGVTETREARPQLLVRTSQFLKKVAHIRSARHKSDGRQEPPVYQRSARSMDFGPKTLSKVDVRAHHHSFDQGRDSGESSPCHVSLTSPPSSLPVDHPPPTRDSNGSPPLPTAAQSASITQLATPHLGLPPVGSRAQTLSLPRSHTTDAVRDELSRAPVDHPPPTRDSNGFPRSLNPNPTATPSASITQLATPQVSLLPVGSRAETLPLPTSPTTDAVRDELSRACEPSTVPQVLPKFEVRVHHQSFDQGRDLGASSPFRVSPTSPFPTLAPVDHPLPTHVSNGSSGPLNPLPTATQSASTMQPATPQPGLLPVGSRAQTLSLARDSDSSSCPPTSLPTATQSASNTQPATPQSGLLQLGSRAQTLPPLARSADDAVGDDPSHASLPSTVPQTIPLSTPAIDGLPRSTDPLSPIARATSATQAVSLPMGSRSQTLPSRTHGITEVARDVSQQSASVDGPTRRALAPRLATLPPPMMAGYNADGRVRLTPSLVARQPPMPLLNLPTLPPPTPSQRSARPTVPLRSIPALPRQGPSEAEQEADHENASLEDDEEDEDGEENAEGASGGGHDADSGSEEEDDHDYYETPPRQPPSASEGPSRLGALPEIDTSRFHVSFADAKSPRLQQRTPHAQASSTVDYFSSKSPEPIFSPMHTPRPADFQPRDGKARMQDVPQPRIVPMPPTPGSPRPGLYHHGSKSMVDLVSMSRKEKDKVISPKLGGLSSKSKQPQAPAAGGQSATSALEGEPAAEPESPDDVITSPMLRRRRSLPVYEPSSDPPPYPDPQFQRRSQHPPIQPRDEEGNEKLPAYSNSIHLAGVMPRKMEFSQPGVQAKDRKWRRVYCVLEGTMFCVYKAPPAGSTVSAIEQWWENKVGVGDITSVDVTAMTTTGIRVSAVRERAREDPSSERPQKIVEEPRGTAGQSSANGHAISGGGAETPPPTTATSRSRFGIGARLLHRQRSKSTGRLGSNSNNNSSSRLSMDSRQDSARQSSSQPSTNAHARRSMDTLGSSRTSNVSSVGTHATTSATLTTPSVSAASPASSSSDGTSLFSRSRFVTHPHSSGGQGHEREKEKETPYTPDPRDLIRKYTLQHAESGLASDYTKRKNVIRVRMEGEQFLLQAKDVASVIDWIEGIQMGTNVALDLDERPMPRGPIFPRRRRRRVRRVEPAAAAS